MDQAVSSSMHSNTTSTSTSAPQEMRISNHRSGKKCPLEFFLRSKRRTMKGKANNNNSSDAPKRIPSLNDDDIKIGCRLGKGSFTKVHALSSISKSARKAIMARTSICSRDDYEDHQFVIKRLRVSAISSAGEKALKRASHQLIGEATLLAQLDHPQIAKLRAFISSSSNDNNEKNYYHSSFALILDRWDCTLREKIDNEWSLSLSNNEDATFVSERLCYALELAEALEYLHDRRLIYRNLEPRNIGFTKSGSVQLFDFGLCRRLPNKSKANNNGCYHMTYAGTARYLAPEVHRREAGGYNLKADVYSWAVVCYEMMSLTEPYQGMSREEHYAEVCDEGFRPCMDDLPCCLDLENLLHQTWCDDLTQRLTMKKVCAALEDIVSSIDPETSTLSGLDDEDDYYDDDSKDDDSTFSTLSDYSWLTEETDDEFDSDDDDDDDHSMSDDDDESIMDVDDDDSCC